MIDESKTAVLPEDSVIRLLEQQARYGMDQESMLIYMCSLNLMSILNLMGRRHGGGTGVSLPVPAGPALPLPPLSNSGQVAGGGPSLESMMNMLMSMLGSQGGAPGGQGLNPALLMSLLNALGGQNLDLAGLMGKLAGLMGSGAKPAAGPEAARVPATTPPPQAGPSGAGCKESGTQERPVKQEVPKIMKWDHLDDRKKAGAP